MRCAIGVFHFNTQFVAGDWYASHLYCTDAIQPFLEAVEEHPHWRMSVAMAGSCLEWVARYYPRMFRQFGDLIERGQVELISATYTPSIWVAFPGCDLLRSVEINRRALSDLGLQPAELFFAQEAFFGQGVEILADCFSAALCKDDYLDHFYKLDFGRGKFRLGSMPVVAGSNHLLNEMALAVDSGSVRLPSLARYQRPLERARIMIASSRSPARCGKRNGLEWLWYHMGSGHHFSGPHSPNRVGGLEADPDWQCAITELLNSYVRCGYRMISAGDFAELTESWPPEELPPLVEGSLNSRDSRGTYTWMGYEGASWENDCGILSTVARSRVRLRRCESALEHDAVPESTSEIESVWRLQLRAEGSDAVGWQPLPQETKSAADYSRRVMVSTGRILNRHGGRIETLKSIWQSLPPLEEVPDDVSLPEVVPLCVEMSTSFKDWAPWCRELEVTLIPRERRFGLSFRFPDRRWVYCPSGMESRPMELDFERLRPNTVYLPLANGFLASASGSIVIKDTSTVHIAVRLSRDSSEAVFGIECPAVANRVYHWCFFLLRAPVAYGIAIANAINAC